MDILQKLKDNPLVKAFITNRFGLQEQDTKPQNLLSGDQLRTMQQSEKMPGATSVVFPGSAPTKLPSKEQLKELAKQGKIQHMGGPNPFKGLIDDAKDVVRKVIKGDETKIDIKKEKSNIIPVTPKTMPLKTPTSENVIGGYNFSGYATSPDALELMHVIYNSTPDMATPMDAQTEINRVMAVKNRENPTIAPITGDMIINASEKYGINPKILMTLLRKESGLGVNMLTENNPGNILNTDEGGRQNYVTIQEGVEAAAREIARRRVEDNLTLNQ